MIGAAGTAIAFVLAMAATGLPSQDGGGGPRGSSQRGPGDTRHDEVGYAGRMAAPRAGVVVAHRTLPADTVVELTALDSGRTILALTIPAGNLAPDRVAELSTGAATQLGVAGAPLTPVRIRDAVAGPAEIGTLRSGRGAPDRLSTPEPVLVALRRQLPATPRAPSIGVPRERADTARSVAPPPGAKPFRPDAPARPAVAQAQKRVAPPVAVGRYVVQVAAVSDAGRAQALARALDGRVRSAGGLHRVQRGPFVDRAAAERARVDAVRRGYRDAQIIVQE